MTPEVIAAVITGLLGLGVGILAWRTEPPPAARKPLPPAVMEELRQSPRWWDEQFHKALATVEEPAAGGRITGYVEYTTIGGVGSLVEPIKSPKAYRSCVCATCEATIRQEAEDAGLASGERPMVRPVLSVGGYYRDFAHRRP